MTSSEPTKETPSKSWKHYKLYKRIKEAIYGLPLYFRTETNIEGISATDIFTLNSALGATIESQVVETLNNMRALWDPKGWYLLAKEAEPSFRFQVTPSACAVHDLIVVVPWALNNVISGSPKVYVPYVESSSKYAAEYRNYHWEHLRQAKSNTAIKSPKDISPYPKTI